MKTLTVFSSIRHKCTISLSGQHLETKKVPARYLIACAESSAAKSPKYEHMPIASSKIAGTGNLEELWLARRKVILALSSIDQRDYIQIIMNENSRKEYENF